MPTLSRIASPLSRLAPLRRLPFWAQALGVCALFAIAGVAVVDDYGVAWDEPAQRQIAISNADYIAAGATDGLYKYDYRYYGVAFEMPLLLVERALRLQDIRHIYLTRHLLTHLIFIAGGFACAMLAYRMLGSRWVALLAMLMFLLHPRLYAHSFFNSKDIPFAVALLIALYLTHRAFRKDTIGAFLLCGIVAGLAINQRPFALMLLPMILAMRARDLWHASGWAARKRILITCALFAAATLATLYISHPYYWENPLRLIEGVRFQSHHPSLTPNLFMGEIYLADAVPWNYIPVWFAITAPPIALLLSAIGCAAVCWRTITRPLAALSDRETRFRILLLGCFVMPVAVVIILQSTAYNGWRHMYFLWAPFCLLAAVGLHITANISMEMDIWKRLARMPVWVRCGRRRLQIARRTLAYGAAGFGLITTLAAMAAMHPHQQVYFNALVDTSAPGALAKRYAMDYWQVAQRKSLEYLLARYPDDTLRVWPDTKSLLIMPQNDRERVANLDSSLYAADFYLWTSQWRYRLPDPNPQEAGFYHSLIEPRRITDQPPIYSVKAYGNPIALVFAKDARAYNAAYEDVAANGDPLARADFDIYAYDGALYFLSADCPPPAPNSADARFFLHITPEDPADLPADRREFGFENRDFWFNPRAAFFDGKCIHRQPLPDYPIARVSVGQFVIGEGDLWRADINLAARAAAQATHARILAGDYGNPIAQSHFDLYLRDNTLTYLKAPCVPADAHVRFFLHITPANPVDLPTASREFGFANLDFHFADHGARIGDICLATRNLSDYEIESIRTGQKSPASGGDEWRADINLAAIAAAQATHARILAGDYGQPVAQSQFALYLRDNALTYLKEPCAEGDVDARFFLHITPANPSDLPAPNRERGFANLDFWFNDHGARIGDICLATRELPAYAIDRVHTGQFVSGEGAIWRTDFPAAR